MGQPRSQADPRPLLVIPTRPGFNGTVSPFLLHAPAEQTAPVVFTSAHSGRLYPPDFVAAARLDPLALRRSEDSFVDELFAAAPAAGAPLLVATFPRVFCDANREPWELDPTMFADALPDWANTASARVAAGLGTIARVVATGEAIYRAKLPFAEAERRVRDYWQPWHDALAAVVSHTRARFGACLLIDCHSMPSRQGAADPDVVLGDAYRTSCAPDVANAVETLLRRQSYRVTRNDPYAGGYITRHYGRPSQGIHALQVELARDLYMDEQRIEKAASFPRLQTDITALIDAVVAAASSWMGQQNHLAV